MNTALRQLRPAHSAARASGALLAIGVSMLLLGLLFAGCKREPTVTVPPPAPTRVQVVVTLPKPQGPLAKNAACVTPACHARFQTAPHVHGPVALGSCSSCHMPDQGDHHYPLIRTGNATCTFCHAVAGTKPHQHKAVEQTIPSTNPLAPAASSAPAAAAGGCLNCHDPHVSNAKFMLLADNINALCAKCHNVPLKKYAHDPFAAGQCTVCHQAHQSDYTSLLRNGEGPEHCFACHKEKREALATSAHVHPAARQACTICHSPHAADNPQQMKLAVNQTCLNCHEKIAAELAKAKHVHGAVTSGNCVSCHDAHASAQPAELKARTDKVCLTCHTNAVKTAAGRTIAAMGPVLASSNLHGPVRNGSCSDCHFPHAAEFPNLLKKNAPPGFYQSFDIASYALCFSCHDQQLVLKEKTTGLTNFRDGDKNLHFLHVNRADKGRTCKTCHDPHGSNLPKHMAAAVPFEGSNWPMPILYEQSKDGGSCTPACHAEKTYQRSKPASTPPAKRGPP